MRISSSLVERGWVQVITDQVGLELKVRCRVHLSIIISLESFYSEEYYFYLHSPVVWMVSFPTILIYWSYRM